jgi:hypothetical protein
VDWKPHTRVWRVVLENFLVFAAIVGVYLLLQLVVLPRLGFQT